MAAHFDPLILPPCLFFLGLVFAYVVFNAGRSAQRLPGLNPFPPAAAVAFFFLTPAPTLNPAPTLVPAPTLTPAPFFFASLAFFFLRSSRAVTHSGSGMASKAGVVVSLLLDVDAVPVRHDGAQPAVAHTPGERCQAMRTSTVLASVKSTLRNSNGKHISILIRFTVTLKSKSVNRISISKSTVKRELPRPKRIPQKALLQCTRKELAYSKVTWLP